MSRGPSSADPPALVGQQLLAEFVQYGRQRPFEEIVRRYAGMVFNTCYRVTRDKHDAEDATQAVFLTLAVQAKRGGRDQGAGPVATAGGQAAVAGRPPGQEAPEDPRGAAPR